MSNAVVQFIVQAYEVFLFQVSYVLRYPISPGQRLFWLYIVSAVAIAYWVYRRRSNGAEHEPPSSRGFVRFLFPKKVWGTSSAWLDVRYFLFHHILTKVFFVVLLGFCTGISFEWVTGGALMDEVRDSQQSVTANGLMISVAYMIGAIAMVDFVAFFLHYIQHKVPLLWEFHKVHHSPEVMHPLSNYREHPIDNLFYVIGTGAAYGAAFGLAVNYFGFRPSMPELLGVPLIMFAFNLAGYSLRHSHIWLRWPGVWSMVFPSPAHHHVHHSRHPDHLDKNFAFIFPFWDVLFRTYHMPADDKDVEFGILGEEDGTQFNSCLRIYFLPFRNAYSLLTTGKKSSAKRDVSGD